MQYEANLFPYGATYAPLAKATEVDIKEWDEDLRKFKETGLNTFRLFICWDRIEKKRGEYDFSMVDYAFELAQKYDLKVIANVGGTFYSLQAIYPPRWLVYDEGCTLLQPDPDSKVTVNSNRVKLCYDDPHYQELAREFIQKAVARYKDHECLLAWAGWNEPRVSKCFCKDTVADFRSWLKNKYGSLAELEKAWSTEFPVYFRDWADVFPQPAAGFEHGGYVPFLDWEEFNEYNRNAKFNLVRDWVKEVDSETPVISHMISPYHADIFGKEDILGTSIYTIHGDGRRAKPFTTEEYADTLSVSSITCGFRNFRKDPYGFWVVETEAGPVSWVHNTVPRFYSGRQMNARDMFFVGHGARAILRWLYRSRVSDAQAGEFNMVGWDGTVTERSEVCGQMAGKLNEYNDIFQSHIPASEEVFIMNVQDKTHMANAEGYGYRYHGGVSGLRKALRHLGYHPLLCNERQVLEGILDTAKILFCPNWIYLSDETEKALRSFVENGGSLIVESPFATKDERGIHYVQTPGKMIDVFGAQVWDMETLAKGEGCGALPGFDFHAKLRLHGAKVEGTFANGDPAIVSNTYGKGIARLYASQVFINYPQTSAGLKSTEATAIQQELIKILHKAGVERLWNLDCDATDRNFIHVLPRLLPDGRKLFFIYNMDEKSRTYDIEFDGCESVSELFSADDETVSIQDNKASFTHNEWGWSILTGK